MGEYLEIKRFDVEKDLKSLESYLMDCCYETESMTSWLPERLHDLIYRMDVQYTDCGLPRSEAYIFMWEDSGGIVGCILPDDDAVCMSMDEVMKWSACNLGFQTDPEAHGYRNGMTAYNSRKRSSMFDDSFEVIITDENTTEENNVCAFCFVYVDTVTKTALIESVSTREKYRRKGAYARSDTEMQGKWRGEMLCQLL